MEDINDIEEINSNRIVKKKNVELGSITTGILKNIGFPKEYIPKSYDPNGKIQREKHIQTLDLYLNETDRVVIYGSQASGKRSLIQEYLHKREDKFLNCFWGDINAKERNIEFIDRYTYDIDDISKYLFILVLKDIPDKDIIELIRENQHLHCKIIYVIENFNALNIKKEIGINVLEPLFEDLDLCKFFYNVSKKPNEKGKIQEIIIKLHKNITLVKNLANYSSYDESLRTYTDILKLLDTKPIIKSDGGVKIKNEYFDVYNYINILFPIEELGLPEHSFLDHLSFFPDIDFSLEEIKFFIKPEEDHKGILNKLLQKKWLKKIKGNFICPSYKVYLIEQQQDLNIYDYIENFEKSIKENTREIFSNKNILLKVSDLIKRLILKKDVKNKSLKKYVSLFEHFSELFLKLNEYRKAIEFYYYVLVYENKKTKANSISDNLLHKFIYATNLNLISKFEVDFQINKKTEELIDSIHKKIFETLAESIKDNELDDYYLNLLSASTLFYNNKLFLILQSCNDKNSFYDELYSIKNESYITELNNLNIHFSNKKEVHDHYKELLADLYIFRSLLNHDNDDSNYFNLSKALVLYHNIEAKEYATNIQKKKAQVIFYAIEKYLNLKTLSYRSINQSPTTFIQKNNFMPRVFISHKSEDTNVSKKIKEALDASLIYSWLDDAHLNGGANFANTFITEIDKCDIFMPIISELYVQSKWCMEELRIAYPKKVDEKLIILPIVISDPNTLKESNPIVKSILESTTYILFDTYNEKKSCNLITNSVNSYSLVYFQPIKEIELDSIKMLFLEVSKNSSDLPLDLIEKWKFKITDFVAGSNIDKKPLKYDLPVVISGNCPNWLLSNIIMPLANKRDVYIYNQYTKSYTCVYSLGDKKTGKVIIAE